MKTTTNTIHSAAFAAVLAIASLAACQLDRAVSPQERVVGGWRLTSYVVNPTYPAGGIPEDRVANILSSGDDCANKVEFVFSQNETMSTRYPANCKETAEKLSVNEGLGRVNYGWSVRNDTLFIRTPDGYNRPTPYKLVLQGDVMTLVRKTTSQTDGVTRTYTSVFKRF